MKRIAIQGIKGSFHDIAAHHFFENEEVELVCCDTFEEMFARLKESPDLLGLMAIENTIAGSLLARICFHPKLSTSKRAESGDSAVVRQRN